MTRDEQLHSQRRAHALLGKLLDRCEREGLPVIEWDIATHGMIIGRCFDPDHAKRPDELRAWADALGLHDWPERTLRRGKRLQAIRENVAPGVDVEVLADIRQEGQS